eukprot:m51a1_g14251 putative tp53-regulating kinase (233) ;mRNA; r:265106-266447
MSAVDQQLANPTLVAGGATLIYQGAEARVYRGKHADKDAVIKERFSKKYRHPTLDATLTKRRLKAEVKCIERARKAGVAAPAVYYSDVRAGLIWMEDLGDRTVKSFLWLHHAASPSYDADCEQLCEAVGEAVAMMHDADLIHGDLTTSNFALRDPCTPVPIDFGLSFVSGSAEDKAVDLYVLERAFLCTHPDSTQLYQRVLKAYERKAKCSPIVMNRLEQVRLRGRKKLAFG